MALVEVKVPDIGDFDEVAVIEVLVKPGDAVKLEQSLITVESDKASMEIPSSHAGVVKELKVQLGDKVREGSLVLVLEARGEAAAAPAPVASAAPSAAAPAAVPAPLAAPAAAPSPAPAPASAVASTSAAAIDSPPAPHNPTAAPATGLPHASPSVRKFARELGVPLHEVKGSGVKGRITQADVQAFTKSVMSGAVPTAAQAARAPAAGAAGAAAGRDAASRP
ncbi:MAG: biotin/lipoyl-containing protein, partial [Burkholderiaceae bacterium]